ncbi:MAG: AtpZ/AtpI family protein [Planctomycetaceae bacterium]|nr:AtpZ/AtpI family protein [Planctomycetaceae bacterium]
MAEQERDPEALNRKERANRRFAREEMGELLKLFSGLGVTVAVGIVGFFLLGLWADGRLQEWGWQTRGIPRVVGVVVGVGLSVYWAYLRIARHLERFAPEREEVEEEGDE